MVPAYIADQALKRMRERKGLPAQVAAVRLHRGKAIKPCKRHKRVLRAEPVSIALGISALLGGAAVSVPLVAAATNFIIGAALSVGLSFAASALSNKGTGPLTSDIQSSNANTAQQRLSTRQAAPPKRIIYGEAFVGGALFFEQCKPPYLYRGFMLSARKINGISKIYIGNNLLTFPAITPNTILTPVGIGGQPPYDSHLQLSIRLGDPNQAIDPLLARDFPGLDPSFRQRGIATLVVRYQLTNDTDLNTSLWGASGNANTFAVVQGVSVFDPRDPTQRRDDETTWKFSRNATLCETDFIRANYGGRVNPDKIDWDKIAASADYDDEAIVCADGSAIPRYTVDGMLTMKIGRAHV